MALFGDVMGKLFGDGGAGASRQAAIDSINSARVPTAQEMQVQLQELVSAGVLTPEKAQYYAQNPNEFAKIVMPTEGRDAQTDTLSQLRNIVSGGGNDAQMEADKAEILDSLRSSERGNREAILQAQAARGGLGGGKTLAAQLIGNQQDDAQANKNALQAQAAAEARKMDALKSMASIGQGLQAQDWNQQAQGAQAANAINQFNAANQNAMSQYNTGQANQSQAANLQNKQDIMNSNTNNKNLNAVRNSDLQQQQFSNQLNKGNALAGAYNNQAAAQQQGANQNAAFIAGLANAGSKAFSQALTGGKSGGAPQSNDAMAGMNAAYGCAVPDRMNMTGGGPVPGEAPFPGDTEANDVVPANLSPGEVVVPRTAVQSGEEGIMDFLQRMRGGSQMAPKGPNAEDVLTVLQALTKMREGA